MFAAITVFLLVLSPVLVPAAITVVHAATDLWRTMRPNTQRRNQSQPLVATS
jgi:hypothetical protein